jgi:hypothetical protein
MGPAELELDGRLTQMGAAAFRENFEAGNIEAVLADFAPDIAVYHAGQSEPSSSHAFHKVMFPALRVVLGPDFHFSDLVRAQAHGAEYALLPWTAIVDGIDADGADFVREAPDGRLAEIRFAMRPLEAVQALHRLMHERIGPPPSGDRIG